MEMNKQRKMLIGVLCVGLGGLAVDRFVIGSPESAAADDQADEEIVQAPPAPELVVEEEPAPQTNGEPSKALPSYASLTERLIVAQGQQATAVEPQDRHDPFALPEQWHSDKSRAPTQTGQGGGSKQHVHITGLFKLDGTVRSLIDGREEMLAVISGGGLDGRAIRVGQKVRVPYRDGTFDEYVLVEVGSRYVIWKSLGTGERIKMQVEKVL